MPVPSSSELEIRRLRPEDRDDLADLFAAFADDPPTVRFFHPHPFTCEIAVSLCEREGQDRYYIARRSGRPVGYAMLRGWDEGYCIPSFGVGVRPRARGQGIAQQLLSHAIAESCDAGASKLRLTVLKSNAVARHIYDQFGFVFTDHDAGSLVGLLDLSEKSPAGSRHDTRRGCEFCRVGFNPHDLSGRVD